MAWEQLLSIYRDAADELRAERTRAPEACPQDGEPLREGPDGGGLFCPFDGWRPDGLPVQS
ncbi:hypothetical protein I5Q34_33300 [Streptomyces sp. AV19]|uniref:hypothetical protein n=1 Tax=Streptomyces sp. AV19 TaxID=2793068 RepID=UPI0018FECA68|nr:hypothetical protein [Streptomyces sp. AV19]MBH1939081.1 hypothetical protein [Streptomyces sp. AV19]MDG4535323.1 Rieske (2Fe-2S) protein [Streptomyces sp. AV19]